MCRLLLEFYTNQVRWGIPRELRQMKRGRDYLIEPDLMGVETGPTVVEVDDPEDDDQNGRGRVWGGGTERTRFRGLSRKTLCTCLTTGKILCVY